MPFLKRVYQVSNPRLIWRAAIHKNVQFERSVKQLRQSQKHNACLYGILPLPRYSSHAIWSITMRLALMTLTTLALLSACTGGATNTPQAPVTPSGSTGPVASAAPSTAPTPAALMGASRLTIDGAEVMLGNKTPRIDAGSVVSVSNSNPDNADRQYTVYLSLRSQKNSAGLPTGFKQEDVDRVELSVEQFINGRSSANKWDGVFDVPSNDIKLTLKNEGGHLMGTVEVTLKPANANEVAMKKNIRVKYEFENAFAK
jgi:hypothetical protein